LYILEHSYIQNLQKQIKICIRNNKIENKAKKKKNKLGKNREQDYLDAIPQHSPIASPSAVGLHTDSGLLLPQDKAARWSSAQHPIHRR
jgi:hypothetical protein